VHHRYRQACRPRRILSEVGDSFCLQALLRRESLDRVADRAFERRLVRGVKLAGELLVGERVEQVVNVRRQRVFGCYPRSGGFGFGRISLRF